MTNSRKPETVLGYVTRYDEDIPTPDLALSTGWPESAPDQLEIPKALHDEYVEAVNAWDAVQSKLQDWYEEVRDGR